MKKQKIYRLRIAAKYINAGFKFDIGNLDSRHNEAKLCFMTEFLKLKTSPSPLLLPKEEAMKNKVRKLHKTLERYAVKQDKAYLITEDAYREFNANIFIPLKEDFLKDGEGIIKSYNKRVKKCFDYAKAMLAEWPKDQITAFLKELEKEIKPLDKIGEGELNLPRKEDSSWLSIRIMDTEILEVVRNLALSLSGNDGKRICKAKVERIKEAQKRIRFLSPINRAEYNAFIKKFDDIIYSISGVAQQKIIKEILSDVKKLSRNSRAS